MHVLITGSSGLIGSRIVGALRQRGDTVTRIVRRRDDDGVFWDPSNGTIDPLPAHDAVIHLAGENIASGRWTEERKRRIRDSRVQGTKTLATAIAAATPQPSVLVCASATGIYGERGDETMTEDSAAGTGFLADVARAWEEAADPARDAGVRTVHLRLGIVIAKDGGALAKMLTPFKFGVGGRVGSGRQHWSWIAIDDAVALFLYALDNATLQGPINAVAPQSVTNAEFTKTLGKVLGRPTFFPLPAFAARLALGGELADALLLTSTRVAPERLQSTDFAFRAPDLETAIRLELGR